jgi:coenzyme F420-reducing hydrogenase beta subunit
MNEYTFTFQRDDKERQETIEASDFDEAARKACHLCERFRCKISRIEWSEDGKRQRSDVQYM